MTQAAHASPDSQPVPPAVIDVRVDAPAAVVHLVYLSNPTVEDWTAAVHHATRDPSYRPGFGFLCDRRLVAQAPTSEFIRAVVKVIQGVGKTHPARWAVLVKSPAQYGMVRMAQLLSETEDVGEIGVFTGADEAWGWLRAGARPAPSSGAPR